jgi:hypothetical protein
MPTTAVVIPLYKEYDNLTNDERTSIFSSVTHLKDYVHVLIVPDNLNTAGYQLFFNSMSIGCVILSFDRKHFINRESYSKLLKTSDFYKRLSNYDYILIFQTDAYVFRNELEKWVSKGYDYIGAPWFEGMHEPTNVFMGVGNGGFSLRRVKPYLSIAKRIEVLKPFRDFWFKSKLQSVIRFHTILKLLKSQLKIKDMESVNAALAGREFWEDMYWGLTIPNAFTDFRVGSIEDAIKFSFEFNPEYLYKLNGELPFGCHGWFDKPFFKPFISSFLTKK